MGPEKKPAHLLRHMSEVVREVFLSVSRDFFGNLDGAEHISKILRGCFEHEAIDSVFRDMV